MTDETKSFVQLHCVNHDLYHENGCSENLWNPAKSSSITMYTFI